MSDSEVTAEVKLPEDFELMINNYSGIICCDGCDCVELRPWEAVVLKV